MDTRILPGFSGHIHLGCVFAGPRWAFVLTHSQQASAHIFASHLAEGKGLVTGFTFPFKTAEHGIISHVRCSPPCIMNFVEPVAQVAVDAANPEPYKVLSRLFLTTSTGAVQLWQQDKLQWTREEGLADIRVAELVELPERKIASHASVELESFGARLRRQLSDAQVRSTLACGRKSGPDLLSGFPPIRRQLRASIRDGLVRVGERFRCTGCQCNGAFVSRHLRL